MEQSCLESQSRGCAKTPILTVGRHTVCTVVPRAVSEVPEKNALQNASAVIKLAATRKSEACRFSKLGGVPSISRGEKNRSQGENKTKQKKEGKKGGGREKETKRHKKHVRATFRPCSSHEAVGNVGFFRGGGRDACTLSSFSLVSCRCLCRSERCTISFRTVTSYSVMLRYVMFNALPFCSALFRGTTSKSIPSSIFSHPILLSHPTAIPFLFCFDWQDTVISI